MNCSSTSAIDGAIQSGQRAAAKLMKKIPTSSTYFRSTAPIHPS
jgi:hypothetical protein